MSALLLDRGTPLDGLPSYHVFNSFFLSRKLKEAVAKNDVSTLVGCAHALRARRCVVCVCAKPSTAAVSDCDRLFYAPRGLPAVSCAAQGATR